MQSHFREYGATAAVAPYDDCPLHIIAGWHCPGLLATDVIKSPYPRLCWRGAPYA